MSSLAPPSIPPVEIRDFWEFSGEIRPSQLEEETEEATNSHRNLTKIKIGLAITATLNLLAILSVESIIVLENFEIVQSAAMINAAINIALLADFLKIRLND